MASTTVKMTSERPNGKQITKTISYINPNATNTNISATMGALNSLSKNTLQKIQKVSKRDLALPQD